MPCVKVYNNGLTCGTPPGQNNHIRALRGHTNGWSKSASRSNTRFLYSVVPEKLTDYGYAFTFTLKDLPPSPAEWEKIRRKLIERFRRMGMIRLHWLTEWQRRGVPHLHGIVYFPQSLSDKQQSELITHWLAASAAFHPERWAQDIKIINDALGWLEYLSKHAARGVYHYQRNGKPATWEKTGRMWGKSGDWPTSMCEAEVTLEQFHRLRRMMRAWRVADARKPSKVVIEGSQTPVEVINSRRIVSARTCLKHSNASLSAVLGVSEWIGKDIAFKMLAYILENPTDIT